MTLPGKRPFHKYATPETTLAILRNRTVRYSSPVVFNDPFDFQAGLHLDFDLGTLHDKLLDRIHELAAAPVEPPIDSRDPWGKLVLLARTHFPEHGFPKQRWADMSRALFQRFVVDEFRTTQQQIQHHWQVRLLPTTRVFCVSEVRDDPSMWAYYADNHRGAVLELWSLPEEDNALSIAEQVQYSDTPPPFFSEAECLDNILSIKPLDVTALAHRYALAKSSHWRHEREWRVWYRDSRPDSTYDDMPMRPSEFAALYFGCAASQAFIDEARGLLAARFPATRSYVATKAADAYRLEFKELL